MVRFMARRALVALLILLATFAVLFFLLELAGEPASTSAAELLRFPAWISAVVTGEFGTSSQLGAPVGPIIAAHLALSGPLLLMGMVLAGAIGIGGGVLMARRNRRIAKGVLGLTAAIDVLPTFWLSLLLSLIFATGLHWFGRGGFVPWGQSAAGALISLLLPGLALGLSGAAPLAVLVCGALVRARDSLSLRPGRARGLNRPEALRQYGKRAAILEVVRGSGRLATAMIVDVAVVETVFYLPGLGRLLIDAALAHDIVLLRGAFVPALGSIALCVLVAQIAAGWIDPRVRQKVGA